jgi:hypothetical protein
MKNQKLIYGVLLTLMAGVIAVCSFALVTNLADDDQMEDQLKKTPLSDVSEMTDESLIKVSEKPAVTSLAVDMMPGDDVLRGAIVNQSMVINGQGSTYFKYKAHSEGKKELLQFYVYNTGKKKLNVRLTSPLGNQWIETSVAPNTIYAGELWLGLEQAGSWKVDFDNEDGSVIKSSLAVMINKKKQA